MRKLSVISVAIATVSLLGFEVHQAVAACQCMCWAISGKPSCVFVDDTGSCDDDFSYTYKVHFATNDDSCGGGLSGTGAAYSVGGTKNIENHAISPTSFTVSGAGHTQVFTVTGDLFGQGCDGISATYAEVNSFECYTGTVSVNIDHDDNCFGDCTSNANCPSGVSCEYCGG